MAPVEKIQFLNMANADLWAGLSSEYFRGVTIGLITAYKHVTGDEEWYREYMAMMDRREG